MKKFDVTGHEPSLVPDGHKWKLVWQDEFDGTELDRSKWGFRLDFWGKRMKTYTEEGVELDSNSHIKLHLLRKGDDFYSPYLQTGSLTFDHASSDSGIWPFGPKEKPKFMHRYGFYEVRCRQPKNPGWHAAFWLQAPGVGSHPDPRYAGVECDVMESYRLCSEGAIICGNLWDGYGADMKLTGGVMVPYVETPDRWHTYAVDWQPTGYDFYFDGALVAKFIPDEKNRKRVAEESGLPEDRVRISPVSEVDQFLLLSTECHGYRGAWFDVPPTHKLGTPAELLFKAVLPDYFEVDHVRVFDRCDE